MPCFWLPGRFAMGGLREILVRHGRVLVLDAAGTPQAAWWDGSAWAASQGEGDAGVGLFQAIGRLGVDPADAGAFIFCAAPGSVLGIRTCAIAIRTWNALRPRPVYTYDGLELLAGTAAAPGTAYLADARRGLWHWRVQGEAAERITADEVQRRSRIRGLNLATPEGFKAWERLPPELPVAQVPYPLGTMLPAGAANFSPCDDPDAALVAAPSYVTWTPGIHRAPPKS